MPKRIGNLYEKVYEIENIKLAIINASKGKRNRKSVKDCLDNIDACALSIQKMLIEKTFTKSPSIKKIIYDENRKKERPIEIPKFYPDQIVHWALMQVIEPILRNSLIENSFASIKGRGLVKAFKKIKKDIKRDSKNMKYYLKLDIKKCYQNIRKDVVLNEFGRKFKDKDILWLIDEIIGSDEIGIPIGFYTSQWFANFVLSSLDKNILASKYALHYYRYLDDMVIFGRNKKELQKLRIKISKYITDILKLELKHTYQLYNFYIQGLDFVGIRFFKSYSILRKRNFKKARRMLIRINHKGLNLKKARSLISRYGWIKRCNLHNYYRETIAKFNLFIQSKMLVSTFDKQSN